MYEFYMNFLHVYIERHCHCRRINFEVMLAKKIGGQSPLVSVSFALRKRFLCMCDYKKT